MSNNTKRKKKSSKKNKDKKKRNTSTQNNYQYVVPTIYANYNNNTTHPSPMELVASGTALTPVSNHAKVSLGSPPPPHPHPHSHNPNNNDFKKFRRNTYNNDNNHINHRFNKPKAPPRKRTMPRNKPLPAVPRNKPLPSIPHHKPLPNNNMNNNMNNRMISRSKSTWKIQPKQSSQQHINTSIDTQYKITSTSRAKKSDMKRRRSNSWGGTPTGSGNDVVKFIPFNAGNNSTLQTISFNNDGTTTTTTTFTYTIKKKSQPAAHVIQAHNNPAPPPPVPPVVGIKPPVDIKDFASSSSSSSSSSSTDDDETDSDEESIDGALSTYGKIVTPLRNITGKSSFLASLSSKVRKLTLTSSSSSPNKEKEKEKKKKKKNKKKSIRFATPVRRLSDSELVTPTSPYNPKNIPSFNMYSPQTMDKNPNQEKRLSRVKPPPPPRLSIKQSLNLSTNVTNTTITGGTPYKIHKKRSSGPRAKTSFKLSGIFIPNDDAKSPFDDDLPPQLTFDNFSAPQPDLEPNNINYNKSAPSNNQYQPQAPSNNQQHKPQAQANNPKTATPTRKRRNSDTLVWTPTTASAISEYSFMDTVTVAPVDNGKFANKMKHYRSKRDIHDDITNITDISSVNGTIEFDRHSHLTNYLYDNDDVKYDDAKYDDNDQSMLVNTGNSTKSITSIQSISSIPSIPTIPSIATASRHFKNNLSLVNEQNQKGVNAQPQVLPFDPMVIKNMRSSQALVSRNPLKNQSKHNMKFKRKRGGSDGTITGTPTSQVTQHSKHLSKHHQQAIPNLQALNVINDNIPQPTGPTMLPRNYHNYTVKKQINKQHQSNEAMIQKLLGFGSSPWNWNNEEVKTYHSQCRNVEYEKLIPKLSDVIYPTMLSSLALPKEKLSLNKIYTVTVKYNVSTFVSVEEQIAKYSPTLDNISKSNFKNPNDDIIAERIYFLKFDFTSKTTVQMAISELAHKIKRNHPKYSDYLNKLHSEYFILKVCGREDYLKNTNPQSKIFSLSYIRHCIRQNQTHNMELVLLYDDSLKEYDDNWMRTSLKQSYNQYYYQTINNSSLTLPYERLGYNCITKTISENINSSKSLHFTLNKLNDSIAQEIIWLKKTKVPSIFGGDQTSVAYTPASNKYSDATWGTGTFGTKNNLPSTDWNDIQQDSNCILLPEFEHEISFHIASLRNIGKCPRFRSKYNLYFTFVLRIELMFGLQVFEDCSWDITIPKELITDDIKMPIDECTFSTLNTDKQLMYASLPREAVWCFTLYGIKKDIGIEQELIKQKKKVDKLKKKNEPQILNAWLNAQNKPALTGKNSKNYSKLAGPNNNHQSIQISSATVSADFDGLIAKENFHNDFFKNNARLDTVRSMGKSFFNSDDNNDPYNNRNSRNMDIVDKKTQYMSEPIAWCRLPMIDCKHRLRKGIYNLKLWTVPIYTKVKGGPKIDPYSTGNWKKFGSVRDCDLKTNKLLFNSNNIDNNSCILSINFLLNYSFDIIAPIVNMRRPHHIRNKIKLNNKKESGKVLNNIITRDGIFPLDERDKMLIYSNKEKLMSNSANIPTFLRSVSWLDMEMRMEAYDYLEKWNPPSNPEDMIELLRYEFADNRIRLYAINCLNKLDDYTLQKCLLQLVQALKAEIHHSSFLSRFLLIRALSNPFQIGHYLFWHLKSEFHDHNIEWLERNGMLLEEYLKYLPYYPLYPYINLTKQLYKQNALINRLKFVSFAIKNAKSSKSHSTTRRKWSKKHIDNLLKNELQRLNNEIFHDNTEVTLPLNPSYRVSKIMFNKCRFMSSAKVPLWLVFSNADKYSDSTIQTLFKCGDDLRQDILTLQLINMMDSFWLNNNIDCRMKTYEVVGTGYEVGFLQVVLNSSTTNDISGSLMGSNKSHFKYINKKTIINKHLTFFDKKDNYTRSVAGYSVATWCLGIGDRHPGNIMIHQDGTLFHIDFGHFLGNFKEKNIAGGLVKFKREKTPFVFTKNMKYCIECGTKNKSKIKKGKLFTEFVKLLFTSYVEVRIRYKFLLNLLLLMVPSQMPELLTESDVAYFREILRFDLQGTNSVAAHVEDTVKFCLANDKHKKFDNMMHKLAHK